MYGERYETDEEYFRRVKRCMACASDVHTKCSGSAYCDCSYDPDEPPADARPGSDGGE
jgi:hypothetical protein